MLEANRLSDTEAELRKTMALAASVAGGHLMRNQAQAILAVALVEQGRRGEARTLAADACRARGPAAIRRLLERRRCARDRVHNSINGRSTRPSIRAYYG